MLLKTREKKVVVGGPYATTTPDAVLEAGCDFLVIGEAELCISDLLKALERGDTKGVKVTLSPDPALEPVELDPTGMRRCLLKPAIWTGSFGLA